MHNFEDLIDHCTGFTLGALEQANARTMEALQTSAAPRLVISLQMVQLQKAIFAVGMFSLFEARLQARLNCTDGFREAVSILDRQGEAVLKDRFVNLQRAINVFKHGRGRSYDELVAKASGLKFKVKPPGEAFFSEGDVSEVATLVEVDDAFVRNCSEVIREVSRVLGGCTQRRSPLSRPAT